MRHPTSALRAPPSKGRRGRYTQNAPHSRPFLWKGLSSVARRGWLPRMLEMRFPISLSPPLSGIAFIKNRREASHLLAFPIGEGGPRQRCSGAFINRRLETLLPALFHAACALSAPSGHLPLEGKADDTGKTCDQQTFGHRLFYFAAKPLLICFPHWGRGTASAALGCFRKSST